MLSNCIFGLYFSGNIVMIEVKNLSKSFAEKGVLSDLNFSVTHGQSVAIV